MAKIRIGFGTIFEVENELIGIGTDNPTNTKQVLGNIHATNAKAVGISTLTTYQGFLDRDAKFGKSVININSQAGTLGDIVIDGEVTVSSGSTLCSGVDELTLTNSFSVPTGDTDSRIHCKTAGSMRFNENLGTLEFYTGDEWRTVNSFNRGDAAGRQVIMGGYDGSDRRTTMEFINASSGGRAAYFGELAHAVWTAQGNSNNIRGIHAGGNAPGPSFKVDIQYITIASEGNAIDFGDLTQNSTGGATLASSTRGVFRIGGQGGSYVNSIEYVEIMTLGNSLDFGDLYKVWSGSGGACSSPTRGLFVGGYTSPSLIEMTDIASITIASTGNGVKFGDLTTAASHNGVCSNSVRGIAAGGTTYHPSVPSIETIDFVTIASEGNSVDFGKLSSARGRVGASATQTRGILYGGQEVSGWGFNRIETIEIATAGNSVDFGETELLGYSKAASDSHGGLGGF